MKKLIYKFALLAALLVLMNWIYGKFFFKDDLLKHSDEVELAWQVTNDSCVVIYTGESSNHTYSWKDKDQRKISDFIFDHFPGLRCGDMTKAASHAEVYYYLLKNIPENAPVETVIVTMNIRSFGYDWIESDLETAIQKQLVLLKPYPPFYNRFKLAFKAYDIKTESERGDARGYHRRHDKLVFPYQFDFHNTADWDYAKAHQGVILDGKWNQPLTELACHYIKTYGFQIHENNPRIKDFDNIVKLAKERGWHLIFNLLAENVDRANELVGSDILYIIRQNRDYLLNRYGNIENVTVVDNIGDVRNGLYIDQNWTTEHYSEMGRRTVANHVAQAVSNYYPDIYVEKIAYDIPKNHYRIDLGFDSLTVCSAMPYGLTIKGRPADIDSNCEKVYISSRIWKEENSAASAIVMELYKNGVKTHFSNLPLNDMTDATGKWDFTTTVLPVDSTFFDADEFRIFLYNPADSPIHIKSLDVSFEYDEYARSR